MLLYGEKIAKISLVDSVLIGLDLKKQEITESKIAQLASLPSGLTNDVHSTVCDAVGRFSWQIFRVLNLL